MVGTCESPTPGYCACEAVKNTIYYYNLVEWATVYVIGFETSIYLYYIALTNATAMTEVDPYSLILYISLLVLLSPFYILYISALHHNMLIHSI